MGDGPNGETGGHWVTHLGRHLYINGEGKEVFKDPKSKFKTAEELGYKIEYINKKPKQYLGKHFSDKKIIEIYTKERTPEQIQETLDHEIGHIIDYKRRGIIADPMGDSIKDYQGKFRPMMDSDIYFRIGPEIKEAENIRKQFPKTDTQSTTQKEIYADAYKLLKRNPEKLKEIAPTIYKKINDFLEPNDIKIKSLEPELKGLINDILNNYMTYIDSNDSKDFMYRLIEKKYNEGLDEGEIQFNRNFVPNYHTVSFIQKFAFDNVKNLTEEMKDKLRKEMALGLMNGEAIPQLRTRIMDVMEMTIQRAEMIARTESVRAFNMGHYQSAKDSGLDVYKEWSAQPERMSKAGNHVPCPICTELDKTQVPMDSMFIASNGEEYLLPPTHPHCACRVLYVQKQVP